MAPRRSNIDDTKDVLKGMIVGINEQIGILQDFVQKCKNDALKDAEELLAEKSKTRFFRKFPAVSQKLAQTLSDVSLVTTAIYSLDEDGTISSSEEDENSDACSVTSAFTVTSVATLMVEENHGKETDAENDLELFPVEELNACDLIQLDEKPEKELTATAVTPPVEAPMSSDGVMDSFQVHKVDVPASQVQESEPKGHGNVIVPRVKAKKTSPPKQGKRASPATSVSPLLPKVLTNDVKVPKPKMAFEVSQTVLVTEMEHPWSFYVQLYNEEYQYFMEKLCFHFSKQASEGYRGGISNIPEVGSYCCVKSPYDQTWYRAQILSVRTIDSTECTADGSESFASGFDDPLLNSILVSTFMIDEGKTEDVTVRSIRPLEEQFAKLPAQAVHCMMGGIAPVEYESITGNTTWSESSISWFKCTMKSENFFTGFFYEPSDGLDCIPVDLYTGEYSSSSDALLPPIDTNISYMMLLVSMASRYPLTRSHIREHYHEIDAIGYKASDHIINDEEAADLSIEIEKNVEAINLKSKPEAMNSIVTKQLDSSKSTDVSVDLVNEKTVQGTNGGRPSLNSNLGNPVLSVSKPELKATFENRFVEKKFTVGAEGFCPVVVSTVKSPGLFYVHLITPDVKLFGEMIYQLDQCYSNNEFHIPEDHLNIGDAVVVKYSEDGCWNRGVIKHLRIPNTEEVSNAKQPRSPGSQFEYEVLHVDFGSTEWVKHENVRPVVEKFFQLPMETVPCCLADIKPMEISRDISTSTASSSDSNGRQRNLSLKIKENVEDPRFRKQEGDVIEIAAGDEGNRDSYFGNDAIFERPERIRWSEAATKRLQELTLDGKQRMASLKDGGMSKKLSDEVTPIYLYNTNAADSVFINKVLVEEALAVSNVLPKTTDDASYSDTGSKISSPLSPTFVAMENWDPMKKAFLSSRNAYSIDPDDPGVAISGYAEPQRNICKYYVSRYGCFRGPSCPFAHPASDDPRSSKIEALGFANLTEQYPKLPAIGSIILIQITSLITPVHFYLRFPYGTGYFGDLLKAASSDEEVNYRDELMDLQEEMNIEFAKLPYRRPEMITYQEGDLIAARFPDDGHWYRARVLHVLESEYKVSYIDYGNVAIVKPMHVRGMLPRFLKLRPQAVEAFLANVELAPSVMRSEHFQKEATEFFEHVVDDGLLTARIMSVSSNGTINVQLYNKKTAENIDSVLFSSNYFVRSRKEITRPWSMFDAMAVNTEIKHFTPG